MLTYNNSFAYATFKDPNASAKARETMDRTIYEGRRITVQFSNRQVPTLRNRKPNTVNPPSKPLFIGNMSFEMTDGDLNELFQGIRNVIDVRVAVDRRTGQPRGFAHADFIDVESAIEAQKILSAKETLGRQLRVDFSVGAREKARKPPVRHVATRSAPQHDETPAE